MLVGNYLKVTKRQQVLALLELGWTYLAYAIGAHVFTNSTISGWTSVTAAVVVLGGVQLIMIGVVGEYIGKILSELKARPIYFVAEHSEKRADTETAASASERTAAE